MKPELLKLIERVTKEIDLGWNSLEQAVKLANTIMELRPKISVEIGVCAGRGLIVIALAHKEIAFGRAVGVDPWSVMASLEGEPFGDEQRKWWAAQDHEAIYESCKANIEKFGVKKFVTLFRKRSDDLRITPRNIEHIAIEGIDFLRIDGNHGAAAFRDVQRYCPLVNAGGILHLDDLNWKGGASECGALEFLEQAGWKEIDRIETGAAYQKIK